VVLMEACPGSVCKSGIVVGVIFGGDCDFAWKKKIGRGTRPIKRFPERDRCIWQFIRGGGRLHDARQRQGWKKIRFTDPLALGIVNRLF